MILDDGVLDGLKTSCKYLGIFAIICNKSKVVVQKALDETQLLFDSLMQEYFG